MKKFETIYRNAKSFAKSKGIELDGYFFYQVFRNEMNIEAEDSMDYIPNCECGDYVTQGRAVYDKLKGTMSIKNMCRQFYGTKIEVA